MAVSLIQPNFNAGELAPSLFGRVDLRKFHSGASTMRNAFVNYKGGASSRAGTKYILRSRQEGTALPPRLIPFQFSIDQSFALEFGNAYMRVIADGGYVLESPITISGATQANPIVITATAHGLSNDDWIFIDDMTGMTELNGKTFIVAGVTTNTFFLKDLFGNFVNSLNFSTYTGGGTASRIYTLTTPYAVADLPLLKYTQSADVMTLTHPSYPPYDLTRTSNTNWSITATTFASSISAPLSCSVSASVTTGTASIMTSYNYVVTAVDGVTGEESVASPIAGVTNSVNMAITASSQLVTWSAVTGAQIYNIYRAPASFVNSVPVGSLYGYVGSSFGLSFVDTNITADFTQQPPLHLNPFAPSAIIGASVTAGGTGYSSTSTVTITTSTGSGAVLVPVIVGSAVAAIIIQDGGHGYASTDTVSISGGTGAAVTLNIGPATGIYPGVASYFQARRVYANSTNNPDTYWMSQTGAFTNFDAAPVPIDSDAIEGTPWAQQVNGIQALVPMPGGLVILTGLGAWQLNGGAAGAAVTPASQDAQPQAYNGCNQFVPPLTINYDILYLQSRGAIPRDLAYSLATNIYTGTDLSVLSNHLFENHEITQWAWAEEPYKVVWCIRDDGVMLSLTFLREQEVYGWSRHDTNGLFISVCSVSEPPVNAVYVVVKRYVQNQWVYYIERMDNRLWSTVEDCWCVDSGLTYPQPTPAADIYASTATGDAVISAITVINGGSGYTAPTIRIDDTTGVGAVATATVVGGVITAITVDDPGAGYTNPRITILDSTGLHAQAQATVSNFSTFTTSAAVFSSGDIGSVIRMGGGVATITSYISPTEVIGDLTSPITSVLPNDLDQTPIPVLAGNWTMTAPTQTVGGLDHLEGKTVSILADGSVVSPQVVTNGEITLAQPASSITVGLAFTVQVQSLYMDTQNEATIQGKRKDIFAITARVDKSRGFSLGSNQIDASTQPNGVAPPWTQMIEAKQRGATPFAGMAIPLYTGDLRINTPANWAKPGQAAIQQEYPLPLNVLAFIPEVVVGDSNG